MEKSELIEKVGKRPFLADDYTLAAVLNYIDGIPSFDDYLKGKSLKEIHAVIHLTKYPKGVVFKIAKITSSIPFGISYSDIVRTLLTKESGTFKLIIEVKDNHNIVFSFDEKYFHEVKQFLDDINLKYEDKITKVPEKRNVKKVIHKKENNNIPPKSWLLESILVTIFCCLPLGIAGIVNAAKVESRYYAGDIDGAKRASEEAAKWTKIGFWIAVAGIVIYAVSVLIISMNVNK